MSIVTFPSRGLNRMTPSEADKLKPAFAKSAADAEATAFGRPVEDGGEEVIEDESPKAPESGGSAAPE